MDLDPFAAQSGEDSCIPRVAANDLGEDGGHRSHGTLSLAHLAHERPHAVATDSGAAGNRGERVAIKQQHQPA
jgi:hypothetical protein